MPSKYATICVKCAVVTKLHEMGVLVLEGAGTTGEKKFFADMQICPSCGMKVLSGFGAEIYPHEEHYAQLINPVVTIP